ncbi:AAA family ATPase [Salinarimonas sp.]|uniref:AAA family ATPase n=1 Tax=Salinarimonas sp. TaxID=2766526 RepID=UPI00391DC39D
MDPLWSLEVEGFGRIAHARIEQAPLIVLVGKNNSGKSYMASLLWGLMNIPSSARAAARRTQALEWILADLQKVRTSRGSVHHAVSQSDSEHISGSLNRIIEDPAFIAEIFSDDQLVAKKIVVKIKRMAFKQIGISSSEYGDSYISFDGAPFLQGDKLSFSLGSGIESGEESHFAQMISDFVVHKALGLAGWPMLFRPIYLPAARTGILMSLKSLMSSLVDNMRPLHNPQNIRFTLPAVQFLQMMVMAEEDKRSESREIAEHLESSVLAGRVRSKIDGLGGVAYKPRNTDRELPLFLSSSMVAELAPFLILLRSHFKMSAFIIEEPEAHLHLSAQREMARALVKIVNLGIPVVITTHSDTFVQQINLLMHLHGHKRRDELMAKFGYEANETLDPEKARAYEFVDDGSGRTVARELTKEEEGFVVPSLNETLADLAKELYEFDKS